ncbi:tRNA (guanine-N1)-methyltransferase [Namhaeicola litoreus]|uniref:tRNA (Guanine-N1)-methyltransferase n=1 Tax=Namhaeicola litoreus TaxID=1052145 RepID=A0ABW3Y466_9FLAO
MKFSQRLFLLLILLSTFTVFAQDDEPSATLEQGAIEGQFDYLYNKSGKYQEYKVIKITSFNKLKANVLDSLLLLNKQIVESDKVIKSQLDEIKSLKDNLKTTNDNLVEITNEKDNITGFGVPMTKGLYNTIMYSLIFGLLGLLLFFIYRFKESNKVTKLAQKTLAETEEEFENYKRVSIEREQKVRRELQDELNKQKYSKKSAKE